MSAASDKNSNGEFTTLDRSPSGYRFPDKGELGRDLGRDLGGCEALAEDHRPACAEAGEAERILQLLGLIRPVAERGSLHTYLLGLDAHCCEELLLVLPKGSRPCNILPTLRSIALRLLNRDVRVRMLYQHAARGDLVTRASVRELTHHGAEVRTSAELIGPLVASDRELVLLPATQDWAAEGPEGPEGPEATVAAARDPAIVSFVRGAFENLWNTATPFMPDCKDVPPAIDDLKKSIVQLLAMGHKDELVSRRLGISIRTCRRHIAEIMEELSATSRFQAGVNLVRAGILDGGHGGHGAHGGPGGHGGHGGHGGGTGLR
ncbi:LuxR C-terminal-related transcriptional regulator [Streptomyces sp. AM 4-1-1]|uniref:LuxR C-terminal-related transcriptional regulator n=1 Tax=Streptomyces sp. AM 4-1-1 TaxID=3028710 RepID=UPI0023B92493|nr:LuxR C-terminal-related transcriptional regulator [Streptomyces sp. AM 4-1-1]WEH34971.1 LuxR C-terminal-related transcriptional regulator [Streptomyces sp. AM 4-1-1]